ncbi:ADP-ribosylglycohydrolase family protein [Nocardioides sp. CFH 31398]|uniref:ADP-ribosylglycohydrolase family protein n=1 Tax=Nocardioides sp. CFH 31398 TaxID=2919579 RepID=UPI001F069A2B|nr:ADP-ribosylglycohydrolase family protein [Nocardioides sp. CFH 31398]MCH1867428.1 ADP-ribosylglycohydrolase family protein [Nocardioides sp. CFH 31398]
MTLTAAQTDRAIGTLVASAAGDALGAGYEFGSAPYDGLPRMIGGGLGGFAPGEWTDDTAQAMAIARVAATGVDLRSTEALDAIAAGFAEWYAGGPSDVGIQTAEVLRAAGRHPTAATMTAAAKAEHDRSGRSAGNGSLMRTAPVALAYLGPGEQAALVEAAHAVSALTHHDPLAGDGAALWCLMVREAVLTGDLPTPGELVGHLRDPDRWLEVLAEAEANQPETFTENGWVVGALQAAWSAITHTPTPVDLPGRHLRDALATAIGIGHDTDTVAAIAGGLLGARWGVTAVPLAWQRILHGWPGLRTIDLTALAVRIAVGDDPRTWPQTDAAD